MKIIDYINCNNDNIISKESKMIANVLLSGTPYQIYNYKQISDEVYNKYGCYIRFNYLDKTASQKSNISSHTVGQYAGEVSELCSKLSLPLISVMIFNGQLPGEGFYSFPQCKELLLKGLTEKEISTEIREQVAECFNNNSWNILIDYLNKKSVKINNSFYKENVNEYINKEKTLELPNINSLNTTNIAYYEGNTIEITILQKTRNKNIVKHVKEGDKYTCKGCGFYFYNKIVEVHHLIPLSNMDEEKQIKKEDLITLCPNCHAIAHLLLNEDEKYKNRKILIDKLQEIYKLNK